MKNNSKKEVFLDKLEKEAETVVFIGHIDKSFFSLMGKKIQLKVNTSNRPSIRELIFAKDICKAFIDIAFYQEHFGKGQAYFLHLKKNDFFGELDEEDIQLIEKTIADVLREQCIF